MKSAHPTTTLQRYFSGIAEYVFQSELGLADPPLTDYVSGLLMRFVRTDAIHKVRNLTGRPITEVAEMLVEANARVGTARRAVHRHIGDFTLFWAGVYPEALREMQSSMKKDHFIDYCSQGKRAYFIASTIETDEEAAAPRSVLERLSEQFELCAYGLREVRREWERRDDEDILTPLLID
ncbi:MAG: hypothetical protein CMJ64_00610 [Planctomycetaceae bacterium]|nr:hypothetical protein [Planctomycetaceae bacterium]